MKKYKWIEERENPYNITYVLQDNNTKENIAVICENNYCDYTYYPHSNSEMFSRMNATLNEMKRIVEESKGIVPEEVEN